MTEKAELSQAEAKEIDERETRLKLAMIQHEPRIVIQTIDERGSKNGQGKVGKKSYRGIV